MSHGNTFLQGIQIEVSGLYRYDIMLAASRFLERIHLPYVLEIKCIESSERVVVVRLANAGGISVIDGSFL